MSHVDEQLTEAWLACGLGRGISHEEHVRIAVVLLRRDGRERGVRQLEEGTLRNCAALGVAERYDATLTRRWAEALAGAIEATGATDADELLRQQPQLRRSDLFGLPAWRRT